MNCFVPESKVKDIYIFIIYTPNLGLAITILGREREQGHFKGSTEEVRWHSKEAAREQIASSISA